MRMKRLTIGVLGIAVIGGLVCYLVPRFPNIPANTPPSPVDPTATPSSEYKNPGQRASETSPEGAQVPNQPKESLVSNLDHVFEERYEVKHRKDAHLAFAPFRGGSTQADKDRIDGIISHAARNYDGIKEIEYDVSVKRDNVEYMRATLTYRSNGDVLIEGTDSSSSKFKVEYVDGVRRVYENGSNVPSQQPDDVEEGTYLNLSRLLKQLPFTALEQVTILNPDGDKASCLRLSVDDDTSLVLDEKNLRPLEANLKYASGSSVKIRYSSYAEVAVGSTGRSFAYPQKFISEGAGMNETSEIQAVRVTLK